MPPGGRARLPGDDQQQIVSSIDAGVDMVMVPAVYPAFFDGLKAAVAAGRLPMARIDDAVRRILTVKFQMGLFERPMSDPKQRADIGSAKHRTVARHAVRESQVLLVNKFDALPLKSTASNIWVAGAAADDIGTQRGGWTISWQGETGPVTDGTTILQAIPWWTADSSPAA